MPRLPLWEEPLQEDFVRGGKRLRAALDDGYFVGGEAVERVDESVYLGIGRGDEAGDGVALLLSVRGLEFAVEV